MTNPAFVSVDAPVSADIEPNDQQVAAAANSLLDQMPQQVQESFSLDQRHALGVAVTEAKTRRFLVNLRLTLFGFFFNIIIGRENRNPVRQAHERKRHPLATTGNLFVLALIAMFGMTLGWSAYQLVVHGGF